MTLEKLLAKLSSLPKNYKVTRGFADEEMDLVPEDIGESVTIKRVYISHERKEIRLV